MPSRPRSHCARRSRLAPTATPVTMARAGPTLGVIAPSKHWRGGRTRRAPSTPPPGIEPVDGRAVAGRVSLAVPATEPVLDVRLALLACKQRRRRENVHSPRCREQSMTVSASAPPRVVLHGRPASATARRRRRCYVLRLAGIIPCTGVQNTLQSIHSPHERLPCICCFSVHALPSAATRPRVMHGAFWRLAMESRIVHGLRGGYVHTGTGRDTRAQQHACSATGSAI